MQDDATPNRHSQTARATSLVISTLAFFKMIRQGTLPSDKWRDVDLDMTQYDHLFHSTRIPKLHKADEFVQKQSATHLVIMAGGQVYWFHVLSADGETCLPPETIASNLRTILHDAASTPPGIAQAQALGAVTAGGRDEWAALRSKLESDAANAESLQVIDSALFVLNLDAQTPKTLTEASVNFLGGVSAFDSACGSQKGSCLNRWYDKTVQLIVCANGMAGVNFQHSHVDGHTVLRYASDIITDSILRFAQSIRGGLPSILAPLAHGAVGQSPAPQKIVWRLDAGDKLVIKQAEATLGDVLKQVEIEALEFQSFGSRAIKTAAMSPDAFVQAGIQLAYYRVYGTLGNTYETVMTKFFQHGRTEPVRTSSTAMLRFVQTACEEGAPAEEQLAALKAALKEHSARTKVAAAAMGGERHLFALHCIARQLCAAGSTGAMPAPALPALFTGKAWSALNTNTLSTSNCGNPSLRLFGFGPVAPQGFGIGYLIKEDGIQFCISSKCRQTSRFCSTLQRALGDMMRTARACSTTSPTAQVGSIPLGSVSLASFSESLDTTPDMQ
jgi:carnitine O-acetyltransferase